MTINKDDEIFKGTTFSDIMSKINSNQKKRSNQIDTLINELKPLIKKIEHASLLVPLIKEYLDIAVKNDDQLIKLAAIYQRYMAAENKVYDISSDGITLSDEERAELMEINKNNLKEDLKNSGIISADEEIEKKMTNINNKLDDI